jgi:hypothetical protein
MVDRWIQTDHAARVPIHGMLTAVGDLPRLASGAVGATFAGAGARCPAALTGAGT